MEYVHIFPHASWERHLGSHIWSENKTLTGVECASCHKDVRPTPWLSDQPLSATLPWATFLQWPLLQSWYAVQAACFSLGIEVAGLFALFCVSWPLSDQTKIRLKLIPGNSFKRKGKHQTKPIQSRAAVSFPWRHSLPHNYSKCSSVVRGLGISSSMVFSVSSGQQPVGWPRASLPSFCQSPGLQCLWKCVFFSRQMKLHGPFLPSFLEAKADIGRVRV